MKPSETSLVSKVVTFLSSSKPQFYAALAGSILTALIPQLGYPWQGIARVLLSILSPTPS